MATSRFTFNAPADGWPELKSTTEPEPDQQQCYFDDDPCDRDGKCHDCPRHPTDLQL